MGIERTQSELEHSTFEPAFVAGSLHIASYGKLRDLIPGAFMLIKIQIHIWVSLTVQHRAAGGGSGNMPVCNTRPLLGYWVLPLGQRPSLLLVEREPNFDAPLK